MGPTAFRNEDNLRKLIKFLEKSPLNDKLPETLTAKLQFQHSSRGRTEFMMRCGEPFSDYFAKRNCTLKHAMSRRTNCVASAVFGLMRRCTLATAKRRMKAPNQMLQANAAQAPRDQKEPHLRRGQVQDATSPSHRRQDHMNEDLRDQLHLLLRMFQFRQKKGKPYSKDLWRKVLPHLRHWISAAYGCFSK